MPIHVSAATRLLGIIGWPVGHSLSPTLHNAALAALDLDYVYVALPVEPQRVGDAVRGLPALGFRGVNVTIPHKGTVVPLMDELSPEAKLIEAVNTVVVEEGGALHGYNTDVTGIELALEETLTVAAGALPSGDVLELLPGAGALVLGAGGAARAAALALARRGLALTVVNRTAARAERLAALVTTAVPEAVCEPVPWDFLTPDLVTRQAVLVNATSLGMAGAGKVPPALADNVTAGQVVVDLVYTRGLTDLLAQAQAQGALVVDGLAILVWQAAAAFRLWTGVSAPIEVMMHAVGR